MKRPRGGFALCVVIMVAFAIVAAAAHRSNASPHTARLSTQSARTPSYDVIIRNGRVMEGSGNPWFRADIGVRDGKIATVGDLSRATAKHVIDARDLLVTPGFIDMHAHCDTGFQTPSLRVNEPWIRQGVTTVMLGVDGYGTWDPEQTASQWLSTGTGTNFGFYVGHNLIRRTAMGIADRAPTPEEFEKMKGFLRDGMKHGDFGLSTGLEYIPGVYSKTDEVIELAKVAAEYGGIYETHIRSHFSGFLDSVNEGIEIAEKANIPVHLDHFKVMGNHNWWMMPEGLLRIRDARARGLDITLDVYPWDDAAVGYLTLLIQVPPGMGRLREIYEQLHNPRASPFGDGKLQEEFRAELIKAFAIPAQRDQLRAATDGGLSEPADPNWVHKMGYDWIGIVRSKQHSDYIGHVISDIAQWRGVSGFDLVADLITTEGPSLLGNSFSPLLPADVVMVIQQPFTAFSSDGALVPFGSGFPHPRAFGSFARVYGKYIREEHALGLEDAVRKMTSLPAQIINLSGRGRIAVGYWADITIFDPNTMANKATYAEPFQYAVGVHYVLVNGKLVLDDGKLTGELPGKLLLHQQ